MIAITPKGVNMAHQNIACEPLASVIQDVRNWDASIAAALMTDYVKLDRICKTRGISVLLSDLPSHGKALDKALSSGFLTLQKTKGQSHRKSFEPKWFSALYWTIFD